MIPRHTFDRLYTVHSPSTRRLALAPATALLGRLLIASALLLLTAAWTQATGSTAGTLTSHTYQSSDWGSVDLLVYTPPGYFSQDGEAEYPVLYFLHGSGGGPIDMIDAFAQLPTTGNGGAEKLDSAIVEGLLPPMIAVAVAAPGGNWDVELAGLLTQELVVHIDRNWRTIADRRGRSLEGFSAGALGVARYLTPNPELFVSTTVMGGGFENYRWSDHAPQIRDHGLKVNILVGDADGFLPDSQALESTLQNEAISHQMEVLPGVPHNCKQIYQAGGLENLQFHAAAWSAAGVVEAGDDRVLDGGAPAQASVAGQILDGGSYGLQWQQVSGPANGAAFTSPTSLSTQVSFSQIGTYGLRLTASDGSSTYEDLLSVSVVDLGAGLEMHLPLDTDLADATGNAHDGSAVGGPSPDPAGRIGGAYAFDGVDDMVLVPDFDYGPSWSIAFWFKAPNLAGSSYQYMVSHGAFDAKPSLNAYLPESSTAANSRVRTVLRDSNDPNGQYLDSAGSYEGNDWHHFVLAVEEGGSQVFVNGQQAVVSPRGGDVFDPAVDLHFGGRSVNPAGRYFEGWLDDVRLYTRSLEAAEAALLGFEAGADQAPISNAGANQAILEGEEVLLFGSAVDDGEAGSTSFAWSQISGPGQATFSHPSAAISAATFDVAGAYVLRLEVSDGQSTSTDEVSVAIQGVSDPIGHWLLDEQSGTSAADSSVQGNTGTLVNQAPMWTGGGLAFDSSGPDAVILGQPDILDLDPSLSDISLVAWVRADPGAEGTLISKAYGSLSQRQYQLYLYDSNRDGSSFIYGIIGGKANNRAVGVEVDDSQWHLVALVHESATMTSRMYVDGVAIGEPMASGAATNGVDVLLGARRNNSSNGGLGWALTAELGEARIYAYALDAQEMGDLWVAGPGI